jgi:hypothetical protein
MFIIWGTKVNQDPRGTVADKCPVCMETERFAVTDHYEVGHIYFISLGPGTRVASTRACWRCGTEFNCVPDGYDEFLPDATAEAMSIDEIVERTNSQLAVARDARKQLEEMAREPSELPGEAATGLMLPGTLLREVPPSELDRELRLALARLEAYEGTGPEVTELLQKLQAWRGLDAAGRAGLLQQVDAFIDSQQKIDRAISFLATMSLSFPQFLGCLPALALLVALASFFLWAPFNWNVTLAIGYALFGLLIVCVFFYYITNVIRRRWFRSVLIPQADEEGVDLKTLVVVMISIARSKDAIDEKVRELSSEARLLRQEVVALGRWEMRPTKSGAEEE